MLILENGIGDVFCIEYRKIDNKYNIRISRYLGESEEYRVDQIIFNKFGNIVFPKNQEADEEFEEGIKI